MRQTRTWSYGARPICLSRSTPLPFVVASPTLLDAAVLQRFTEAGSDAVDAAEALSEARQVIAEQPADTMLLISRPHDQFKWRVGATEPAKLGQVISSHFPDETVVVVYIRSL